MKKHKVLKQISQFLGLDYKGFLICFENDEKYGIKDCENLSTYNIENGLKLCAKLNFCDVQILFEKNVNASFSVSMRLFNCVKENAKVYKITPFIVSVVSNLDTRVLINSVLESGIHKYKLGEKGESSYHLILGNGNNNDLTFALKVPMKFRSLFGYEFKRGSTLISCTTFFPLSYKGEYFSEQICIFNKIPSTDALYQMTSNIENKEYEHPMGWSTWDYYAFDISDECIKENTEFICNNEVLAKNLKYIAIDNGWEQLDGDWYENGRLKSGLKEFCRYVKSKGLNPGIWTAPARVYTNASNAMRRITDMLVKNKYGDQFLFEGCFVLDPTHPGSEPFLKETFTFLKDCGFNFYKIDFLNYVTESDFYYDQSAGHYDALRKLIEIIRETVGKDAHIMGCGLPYGTGYGYVDSRRTGLDIHTFWGHIKKCCEYYLPQWSSHNKLYFNDLDYLLVRGSETSEETEPFNVVNPYRKYCDKIMKEDDFYWCAGNEFTYDEAKFWASVILMSGSSIFLGDRLSKLNDKGLKLIERTLENADFSSATPKDLLNYPLPEIWYKKTARQIFVFNWSNNEKEITVNVNDILGAEVDKLFEIYTDEKFLVENGKLTVKLKAHQSVVVKVID